MLAPTDHLCAITDVGRVRDHNEDTFYLSDAGHQLIVADGMGGHQAGEVASALATEVVAEFLRDAQRATDDEPESIEGLLMEALEVAHRNVVEENRKTVPGPGMGATLIVACISKDILYTCHVGDVRCYVRTKTTFQQITKDHSVVGALVNSGQLTSEQARVHPSKNEILQAIGMPSGIAPDVNRRALEHGDRILLCSDGLWEALSDDDICSIIDWEGSMRQLATQLVDRANYAGGSDNITIVLYEHVGSQS